MKTSEQRLNNKKMKKKKKVSKMKKIIIKNAMAIVAIAIAMGSYALMSFDANTIADDIITFEYKPPQGDPNPYSQANVENLSNWEPADDPCPTNGNLAACTIQVHENQTIDGTALDPVQVELQTSEGSPNVFKVNDSPTHGYTNPINRSTL